MVTTKKRALTIAGEDNRELSVNPKKDC